MPLGIIDRMLRLPKRIAGATLRAALRFYRQSPISRRAVKWLRRNPIALAGWRVARRNAHIRGFVERARSAPPAFQPDNTAAFDTPTAAFYTPPVGLLPWFNPLNIRVVQALADRPHLNVLLPSLAMNNLSGGPNTALNLAYRLAALGIPVRFISADTPTDANEDAFWRHLETISDIHRLDGTTLVDASDRRKPLEIGVNDIFMATAWWTAQMAKYAVRHTRHSRFVYLIQDYEPLLHPASTQYALAEETYCLDFIPVINSALLAEFFLTNGIGRFKQNDSCPQALVFEPAIDSTRFYPSRQDAPDRTRRRLLFYARPTKGHRNLFELGVAALQKLIADGTLDPAEWEFVGMGEPFAPVSLGRGAMLRAEPWRSFDTYAALMRHSDVLLSMMLSPHPSYPPIEMAACGRPVVTSAFANKTAERLREISPNIIATEPTVEAIAGGLLTAIGIAKATPPKTTPKINLPANWNDSLRPILPMLYRELVGLFDGLNSVSRPVTAEPFPILSDGYRRWPQGKYDLQRFASQRQRNNDRHAQPGLISFLTTVWNTDPRYIEELADTVFRQDSGPGFEWVLMDNGSVRPETVALLERIAAHPCVRFFKAETNQGIIGGLRQCLERASNRYIVPLDSDDLLTPDCVRVLTSALAAAGYPALAYTDEDKIDTSGYRDAYVKPDFDPVLFAHSCYIAHLCAIDRSLALEFGAYTDTGPEGSHDWDSFTRFLLRGYIPLHVPEILYTWRMHPKSTAGNINSKSFIFSSQRSVLEAFLAGRGLSNRFRIELSPLFGGNPDWRFMPATAVDLAAFATIELDQQLSIEALFGEIEALDAAVDLIHLVERGARIIRQDWAEEALTLMTLFPETDVVGGRVHDGATIREAGFVFGYHGMIGCPDSGRALNDPGYFAQMWKPHSVGAVSARHCVVRRDRLLRVLRQMPQTCDVTALGPWLGASACAEGRRVIYTPFLELATSSDVALQPSADIGRTLAARFGFLVRDPVGYPAALDRGGEAPYQIGASAVTVERPDYPIYQAAHQAARLREAAPPSDIIDFSVITTCYINTDPDLLRATAMAVRAQTWPHVEWVLLAHGPVSPALSALLDELATWPKIRLLREPVNFGICGGLSHCLARATGAFILPLDADDLLTPDAIAVLARAITATPEAELLYSDEDLLIENTTRHPYYRPDLDPVLLLTQSYVWHAIAYRRTTALALGVYTNPRAEFAQDWDTLLRFHNAGHTAVHVAEVLYHWRQHARSVSHSGQTFDGSRISVENILHDIAANSGRPHLYEVTTDPFLPGGSDSQLRRLPLDPPSGLLLSFGRRDHPAIRDQAPDRLADSFAPLTVAHADAASLAERIAGAEAEFVLLLGPAVELEDWSGVWDAIKHLELVPQLMAIGGPIVDADGMIVFGAPVLLPDGGLHDPLAGKPRNDPGAFSLGLKPHCVGALCVDMMIVRCAFLHRALLAMPAHVPFASLGAWLGRYAESLDGLVAFDPSFRGSIGRLDQLTATPLDAKPRGIVDAVRPPIRGLAGFIWHSFSHA